MSVENLEQKLKSLSAENKDQSLMVLEETRINDLRNREASNQAVIDRLTDDFSSDFLNWARSFSDNWKQIRKLLIEAGGKESSGMFMGSVRFLKDNASLDRFAGYVIDGLIPLEGEGWDNPVFFDFIEGEYTTLKREGKKMTRNSIYLDKTKNNSTGHPLELENLIPQKFANRLAEYLQVEKEKIEIPF